MTESGFLFKEKKKKNIFRDLVSKKKRNEKNSFRDVVSKKKSKTDSLVNPCLVGGK